MKLPMYLIFILIRNIIQFIASAICDFQGQTMSNTKAESVSRTNGEKTMEGLSSTRVGTKCFYCPDKWKLSGAARKKKGSSSQSR